MEKYASTLDLVNTWKGGILWPWLGDISGGIFQQRAVDMERIISFGLAGSVNNFYQRDLKNERRCSNTEVQHSSDSGGIRRWAVKQTYSGLKANR